MIIAPDGPDSWPEGDSRNQWLVFYRLDQMSLNGTGTIEGNGDQWWDLPCKPHRVMTLSIYSPNYHTVKSYTTQLNTTNNLF